MRLVFVGPPGAGKGTHAARCAETWGVLHLSTGDMCRAEAKRGTALGQQLTSYMERGTLVPDHVVIALVQQRLADDDARRGCILDGFPRTVAQAQALDTVLAQRQQDVELAIHFHTSEGVILRRLVGRRACRNCGANYNVHTLRPRVEGQCDRCQGPLYQRPDDDPDTIKKRLAVHHQDSAQLLDYYRGRGLLRDVNGDLELDVLQPQLTQLVMREGLLSARQA